MSRLFIQGRCKRTRSLLLGSPTRANACFSCPRPSRSPLSFGSRDFSNQKLSKTQSSTTLSNTEHPLGTDGMIPLHTLEKHLSSLTYSTLRGEPLLHAFATPVQAAVLKLLPDVVEPYTVSAERKDMIVLSRKGSDTSLTFLILAIEARQKAIAMHTKSELASQGVANDNSLEQEMVEEYARSTVGTLVLTSKSEDATALANVAVLLSRNRDHMDTRLFASGMNKKTQIQQWETGRKDIVVATPTRLRHLMMQEPALREGFRRTQLLVVDQADQMLEKGLRDDLDAIVELLSEKTKRQTFIFAERRTHAVKQLAERLLKPDHHIISFTPKLNNTGLTQYCTILPDANHHFSYVLKLLVHDQMMQERSKVIIYLPTWQMTRLFTTMVQKLRETCLPISDPTGIYEFHSKMSHLERSRSLARFVSDKSRSSILLTTNSMPPELQVSGITRVIQLGIPPSEGVYFNRLVHLTNEGESKECNNLVLLPWEEAYLKWQLMDVPFTNVTVADLGIQPSELAVNPTVPTSTHSPLNPINSIDLEVKILIPRLDEEMVRETFVSMLGYYVPKSRETKIQRPDILRGIKDWATSGCGLRHAPYVSEAFLMRLE